jgi:hypothetical protein
MADLILWRHPTVAIASAGPPPAMSAAEAEPRFREQSGHSSRPVRET